MVKPEDVRDDEMILKAREICKKIEEELDYPVKLKCTSFGSARY